MYILAKKVEGGEGYTLHGVSESDKVSEAWYAAGGSIFNIDVGDPITFLPVEVADFDEPEEAE